MKEHGLFIAIIATLFSTVTTWIVCSMFYKDKLKSEYFRGLKTGAAYYKKHGEYPSHWHWNKKYENEDFNIDSFLVDSIPFLQQYKNNSFK